MEKFMRCSTIISQNYSVKSSILKNRSHTNFTLKCHIANTYQPHIVEAKQENQIIQMSQNEDRISRKEKYVMIIPPPNVTGFLHLGHALMATIQDVICRRKQQLGFKTIWIPGTDHAGIATQVVVEKKIFKEKGISRHQLGQNEFINEVWKWKNEKENKIRADLQKLGCLLNWDREYFTMDKKQSEAVTKVFIYLFEENLIERKNSLVNWSCSLESAVSDIEVESREINGPTSISVPNHKNNITFGRLYDISYKIVDTEDVVIVSTTRPETLLGDVAVAVNPEDPRYDKFKNKQVKLWHPFRNEEIPLIFDSSVDINFGTGAVKITPAHDKNDFQIALRHKLNTELEVFTTKGTISSNFKEFSKLPRFEAREKVLDHLTNFGLFKSMMDHKMSLPICSRSKDVIEYILRPQWFLKCQDMANESIKAVMSGEIKIHPKHFESEWFKWLSNCQDWCISRQLWWGHQIPAYLVKNGNEEIWIAAQSSEEALEKSKSKFPITSMEIEVTRDKDVLDTWFSSSILPFSVFDWPKEKFKDFYPLDLLQTGNDILFFWVARMVMLGIKLTGEVPFKNVLLNGIVCDSHGRKMSKSLGNIVTPDQVIYGTSFEKMKMVIEKSHLSGALSNEEIKKSILNLNKIFPTGIPECGTDALRFTLLSHNIKTHFINFNVAECHTNRLFFNKIWQATRFTLQSFEKFNIDKSYGNLILENLDLGQMDKWILSRLANTIKICNESYENYNFYLATQALKTFFYTNFCDTYLETTKSGIHEGLGKGLTHCAVLAFCLNIGVQTLAPITPFIAKELLEHLRTLPVSTSTLLETFIDLNIESDVSQVLNVCTSIRQLKSRNNISKKFEPTVNIFANNNEAFDFLLKYKNDILVLTKSHQVNLINEVCDPSNFNFFSTAGHLCSFGIETNADVIQLQEKSNLNAKKLIKLEKDLNKLMKTISADGYKKNADKNVQKKHLERINELEIEIKAIKSAYSFKLG